MHVTLRILYIQHVHIQKIGNWAKFHQTVLSHFFLFHFLNVGAHATNLSKMPV